MATKSPSRPQSNVKRQIRVAGMGDSADARVLTHLPSTVTTRRPQSPHRRPPSAQEHHQASTPTTTSQNHEPKETSQGTDSRFFRASEAQQVVRTPTTASKPPFFTAKSYSTTSRPAIITPDLRRAESAIDVRPLSNSRLHSTRTPTLRDTSPARKANGTPRVAIAHLSQQQLDEVNSPSPFPGSTHRSQVGRDAASTTKPAPRLPRQASMASLRSSTGTETDLTARKSTDYGFPTVTTEIASNGVDHHGVAANSNPLRTVPTDHAIDATLSTDQPALLSPRAEASISAATDEVTSQPTQIHRKIMDLEIRNTSLLAVNNLMEKQSRKHAVEMKELRKRIVYMTKFPQAGMVGQELAQNGGEEDEQDADEVDQQDDLQEVGDRLLAAANNVDHAIRRALLLSEQLLTDANRGLHYRPRESEIGLGMRRVLLNTAEDDSEVMEEDGPTAMSANQTMMEPEGMMTGEVLEKESSMIL